MADCNPLRLQLHVTRLKYHQFPEIRTAQRQVYLFNEGDMPFGLGDGIAFKLTPLEYLGLVARLSQLAWLYCMRETGTASLLAQLYPERLKTGGYFALASLSHT